MKTDDTYPKVLAVRENSGMTSTWNEYLRLRTNGNGTATLDICRYECLGEWEADEDGEPLPLPDEEDGKRVIGIEDDYVVGGELDYFDDGELTYSAADLEGAMHWITSEHFEVSQEVIQELRRALEAAPRANLEQDGDAFASLKDPRWKGNS